MERFFAYLLFCAVVNTAFAVNPITVKAIGAVYPDYPKLSLAKGPKAALIRRGEYLVKIGDCIACHTDAKHGGKPFAGGLAIKTPFGTFYSPNITPDKKTGIGQWSEANFIRALHEGRAPNGSNYFPVFPYVYFNRVSKNDLRAIWAYLRAIPPVEKQNKPNGLPFPLNSRLAQWGWKLLFFIPSRGQYQYDPNRSKAWNRGAYLVNGLGHCSMCHTPLNALGAAKKQYYLTGSFIDDYWAPNITKWGIGSATGHEIAKVFLSGELLNKAGRVAGPMQDVNHDSFRHLTKADLGAVATYLKTVDTPDPHSIHPSSTQATLTRGREIFYAACSLCHLDGNLGAPRIGDTANWSIRAKQGLSTLYRRTINGFNQMPPKGACVTCRHRDIKAAVDYLLEKSLKRTELRQLKNPSPADLRKQANGKQVYDEHCSVCHKTGKLGAPIVGQSDVWESLLRQQNLDGLIQHTLQGKGNHPPRGACKNCTTSEMIAAIKFMVQQSNVKGNYSLW